MLKHIAVRLKRLSDADIAFSRHGRILKASRLDARDPALRNITEELHDRGVEYEVDRCKLFWCQFDSPLNASHYELLNEVECAFNSEWYEEQKRKIRYLSGVDYVEACANIARKFTLKPQDRLIEYVVSARCA